MIKDIFKKIFSQEREEKHIQTLNLEQFHLRLDAEIKEIESKKESMKKSVVQEISQFNSEVKEEILILEKVDIEKRKEQDKVKQIVKENLKLYIDYVKKLIQELENAENLKPDSYFKRINHIAYNFQKNSRNAFEKATILIGKEIERTKETVGDLFSSLNKILRENKDISEKQEKIEKLKNHFQKLDEIKTSNQELAKRIKNLNQKLEEGYEEKTRIEKELEKIKKSEEYKKSEEEKIKIEKEKQELEKEIFRIKEKLNLKQLAKFFHNDEKKDEIIKQYLENFKSAMEKDNKLEIIELVKEASNLNIDYLREIKTRNQELGNIQISEIDKKLLAEEDNARKLGIGLLNIEQEIRDEEKKKARFKEKQEETTQQIKNLARLTWENMQVAIL